MRTDRRTGWLIWATLLAALGLTGCSLTAPTSSAGHANLESLGILDVDRTVALSMGPTLLRLAAMTMDDEPETAELLRSLDGVRIRIYEMDGDPARVSRRMTQMSDHLAEDGWEPVILIREDSEQTHLMVRMQSNSICGLTLLTSDGVSEAVVINLMGDIRPEQFGDIMLALDVDAPEVTIAGEPDHLTSHTAPYVNSATTHRELLN